jgi:hypothetical protein
MAVYKGREARMRAMEERRQMVLSLVVLGVLRGNVDRVRRDRRMSNTSAQLRRLILLHKGV